MRPISTTAQEAQRIALENLRQAGSSIDAYTGALLELANSVRAIETDDPDLAALAGAADLARVTSEDLGRLLQRLVQQMERHERLQRMRLRGFH